LDVLTPAMGGLPYVDYLKRQFPSLQVLFMVAREDRSKVPSTAPLLFKPFTPEALITIAESVSAAPT